MKTYSLRFNIVIALLLLVLGASSRAQAAGVFCSEFSEAGVRGVVDGNNPATMAAVRAASTFGIDINCTVKNFTQAMGSFPITNINFNFPGQQSFYIAFLDVFYYGNMSCNDPTQSDFWIYWAPGGFNNISPSCQEFMVPVDAVRKKNPAAQTTAAIGVPFTYTITVPLMGKLDATGTFQYLANADDTTITNVVIPDDLTRTGAALSYVSNAAYLVNPGTGARTPLNGGAPLTLGASGTWLANHPGILSDATKHLVFSYEFNPALASLPAGNNIEIDLTVVLDNSPTNLAGMLFSNTAKMWFNKPINTTSMVDLQAQPGTTLPMAIVEPSLTLTKTGSATAINVDSLVTYTLNVQNTGGSDAWNATITDNLPAGMSTFSPLPTLAARIFASDGVTPVSAPLVNGTDFTLTWNGGSSSASQLTLTLLDTTRIAPTQRLIVTYTAQLDSTGVASGTTFTNIAGATRWFSADSSHPGRRQYDRTITDGTPGTLDFQDAYTVTAALAGYYFPGPDNEHEPGHHCLSGRQAALHPAAPELHVAAAQRHHHHRHLACGPGFDRQRHCHPGGRVDKHHSTRRRDTGLHYHHRPESARGSYHHFADPDRLRCHAGREPRGRHSYLQPGEPHRHRLERRSVVRPQ